MTLHRIAIKYFVAQPETVDLGAMISVFHQWIQQSKVPGLLIDVADYRHMIDGPGILLVGHDVDYALDMGNGRAGLLHRRKQSGELNDGLAAVFRSALLACKCLEEEKIRVRTDEAELILEDRLHAPNNASTFDEIKDDITKFLQTLYIGSTVRMELDNEDERQCLTLRIAASDAPDLDTLISRLGGPTSLDVG